MVTEWLPHARIQTQLYGLASIKKDAAVGYQALCVITVADYALLLPRSGADGIFTHPVIRGIRLPEAWTYVPLPKGCTHPKALDHLQSLPQHCGLTAGIDGFGVLVPHAALGAARQQLVAHDDRFANTNCAVQGV